MESQQKQTLLFLSELNTHRLQFRQVLDSASPSLTSEQSFRNLLQIQHLLAQNKHNLDVSAQLQINTNNIMKIINWEFQAGVAADVRNQDKYLVCFDEGYHQDGERGRDREKDKDREREREREGKWDNKQGDRNNSYRALFKNDDQKTAPQQKIQEQRRKPAEFISASALPKSTSVRKKFVPPFKKQKEEELKLKEPIDKQSEDMDPRYQNLQTKLVQIIESEIVERDKKVEWSQIAGLGFAKKIIHEMIVWPMLRPDIFTGLRAPPKGILLFGPPGTGKTMIGRAIASQAQATFFSISASSITSKWVGQSEKLVKTLFTIARMKQPSVIFIDEIDSLLCSRKEGEQESSRRVKTQFLVELDGAKTSAEERVLIIGATNLPQELDDAVRRRFVKRLYIPLPNFQGRKQLLTTLTSNPSFSITATQQKSLSQLTQGYSGADMYNLCSQASMIPLRMLTSIESIRTSEVPVTKYQHFIEALKLVRPSVNRELLNSFQDWNKMYGSYQLSPDQLEKEENQKQKQKEQ